jgi:hypothetical protein
LIGHNPWRARIHSAAGEILGAGVILDPRHVLTCAHVVANDAAPDTGEDWQLLVDVIGLAAIQRRRARVTADGWVPLRSNPDHAAQGDLALLELHDALLDVPGAQLHRSSLPRHSPVWACGYPNGVDAGTWAGGELTGEIGELVEIRTTTVRRSGADTAAREWSTRASGSSASWCPRAPARRTPPT